MKRNGCQSLSLDPVEEHELQCGDTLYLLLFGVLECNALLQRCHLVCDPLVLLHHIEHALFDINQCDRDGLNSPPLEELSLVDDNSEKILGPRADLTDPRVQEAVRSTGSSQKVPEPPLEQRGVHSGVHYIGKGNTIAQQYLARCKETALRVPQPRTILERRLVPRPPEKKGFSHGLCHLCHRILGPEIHMRCEYRIHSRFIKNLCRLPSLVPIEEQTLLIQ